jgi:hypothetical protein
VSEKDQFMRLIGGDGKINANNVRADSGYVPKATGAPSHPPQASAVIKPRPTQNFGKDVKSDKP